MARYPVDNRIKNGQQIPFGGADSNARYGKHAGDDSANGVGTPVYAPATGRVTAYSSSQYHGNVVEIQDDRGLFPHIFHLRDRLVQTNQQVAEGQLVGYSGSTGLSTGPHVHFGVSKKSVPTTTSFADFIDPMEYIKQGGNVKPTREQIVHTIQIVLGYTPGEAEIQAQLGQASLYDVVKSLGEAAQKKRNEAVLSEDDFYRVFRGMLGRDPTSAEAKNFSRVPAVVIPTLWNNGSQARYEEDKNPSVYIPVTEQLFKKG